MRRVFGIIFLALALVSTFNAIRGFSNKSSGMPPRNAAYESGRKAGMIMAPLVLGGIAAWLLLGGRNVVKPPPVPGVPSGTARSSNKLLWILVGAGGGAALLLIGLIILGGVMQARRMRGPTVRHNPQHAPPPGAPGNMAREVPSPLTLSGQAVDFTTSFGRHFSGKAVRTDGVMLFLLTDNGGTDAVPLHSIPISVINSLGIPTNWPTVVGGRVNRPMPGPRTRATPQMNPAFKAGETVEVRWGGEWQKGSILGSRPATVQVQLENSRFPNPIWISTNLVRVVE